MFPLFFTRHHNILQCNVYVWLTCLPQYSSTEDSTPITLILWFLLLSTTQCIHWKQFATYSIQSPPLLTYGSWCSDWAGYALPLLNASPRLNGSASGLHDLPWKMEELWWLQHALVESQSTGWQVDFPITFASGHQVLLLSSWLPCPAVYWFSLDEGMPMTVITCIKSYFHWMAGSLLLCHCDNVIQKENQCSPCCCCKSVIVVSNSGKKKVSKCGHVVCRLINNAH